MPCEAGATCSPRLERIFLFFLCALSIRLEAFAEGLTRHERCSTNGRNTAIGHGGGNNTGARRTRSTWQSLHANLATHSGYATLCNQHEGARFFNHLRRKRNISLPTFGVHLSKVFSCKEGRRSGMIKRQRGRRSTWERYMIQHCMIIGMDMAIASIWPWR